MDKIILTITQQNNEQRLDIISFRKLLTLLAGLEFINAKISLISQNDHLNATAENEVPNNQIPEEYALEIVELHKNSPLHLKAIIRGTVISIKVIDALFEENYQEDMLRAVLSKISSLDFELEENQKLWKKIWRRFTQIKRAAYALDLLVLTQEI